MAETARPRCEGITKAGARCTSAPLHDSHYCMVHGPNARELMARGGHHAAGRPRGLDAAPLPATMRPTLRKLNRAFSDVLSGKLSADKARAAAAVAQAMARLVTVGSLEEKMQELERKVAESQTPHKPPRSA